MRVAQLGGAKQGQQSLLHSTTKPLGLFFIIIILFFFSPCGVKPHGSTFMSLAAVLSRRAVFTLNNTGFTAASLLCRDCILAFPVEGGCWMKTTEIWFVLLRFPRIPCSGLGLAFTAWPSALLQEPRHRGAKRHVPANTPIKAALNILILSRRLCHNVKTKHHLQAMS